MLLLDAIRAVDPIGARLRAQRVIDAYVAKNSNLAAAGIELLEKHRRKSGAQIVCNPNKNDSDFNAGEMGSLQRYHNKIRCIPLSGGLGVVGSNPAAPTIFQNKNVRASL